MHLFIYDIYEYEQHLIVIKSLISLVGLHLDNAWIGIGFRTRKLCCAGEALVYCLFLGGLCFRSRLANASVLPHKRSCH